VLLLQVINAEVRKPGYEATQHIIIIICKDDIDSRPSLSKACRGARSYRGCASIM